ncbi:MAG: class I SAM-dependent methyltransferase [Kofleriaceae bacterium]
MAIREVVLPAGAAAHLARGGLDLELGRLALTPAAAPGTHLRLVDDAGDELGIAIADVDNDLARVWATPADGLPTIGGALVGLRVERALRLRRALGLVEPDATYRAFHGAGDGMPGLACDVLGAWAVLYAYAPALVPVARLAAEAIRGFASLRGVVIKVRKRGGADDVTQEIVGETPPDVVVAHEHGVAMELHLTAGLNHGLFTDMREHRRGLPRWAPGRRVLNLFSYTGALSLACARAGAASVVSVDTSDGVQAWAQSNFARAGLGADPRWRFEVGDAGRFLVRAAKEREQYDPVMIDPPTFSPARGRPWVLGRDYPELIAQAAAVIPDGGLLWLAANSPDLGPLPTLASKGLAAAGRTGAVLELGGLPPDYPTVPAQPKDRYLQVCLLRV